MQSNDQQPQGYPDPGHQQRVPQRPSQNVVESQAMQIPAAKLDVISGNDEGRVYELTAKQAMIGRGAQCDFVLADLAVSRQHMAVVLENNRFRLVDQGSGNGTKVNGVRITTHELADGDIIDMGKTKMKFVCPEAAGLMYPMEDSAPTPARQTAAPPAPAHQVAKEMPYNAANVPGVPDNMVPSGSLEGMAPTMQVDPGPASMYPYPEVSPPTGSVMPRKQKKGGFFGLLGRLTDTTPKKIIILTSIGLLTALMVMAMIGKLKTPQRKEPKVVQTQGPTLEELYEKGKDLVKENRWDEAEKLYVELADIEPDNAFIKSRLKEIRLNQKARDDYERAKKALDAENFETAKVLAELVPNEAQAYFVKSRKILRTIAEKRADDLLSEAEELKDDRKTRDQAIEKVKEALEEAPEYRPALVMRHALGFGPEPPPLEEDKPAEETTEEITEETTEEIAEDTKVAGEEEVEVAEKVTAVQRRPSTKSSPTTTTKPATRSPGPSRGFVAGSEKKFMAFYRARNWSAAAAELNRMAESGDGRRAKALQNRAEQTRRVGALIAKGDSTRMSNPAAAMNAYRTALKLDQSVSKGVHASYIKGQLAKTSQAAAGSSFSRGQYAQAYTAARTAQQYGGDSAVVRRIMDQLEGKAKETFNKGYVIRDSNLNGARNYWRQVLRMVPPSSSWHKKATWFIANYGKPKSRATSAEDEL